MQVELALSGWMEPVPFLVRNSNPRAQLITTMQVEGLRGEHLETLAPSIKIMELARMFAGPDPLAGPRWSGGERTGIISDLTSIPCCDIGQSDHLKKESAFVARQELGVGESHLTNEDLHNKCIIMALQNRNRFARVLSKSDTAQKFPDQLPPCVHKEKPVTVIGCLKKQ